MAVFDSDRPLIFAHRGGAKLAPENTMPALDNGMALGSDGLEFDVQLSSDGVPIVIHDLTLDRTTDHSGPVASFTADQLARVDAGYRFERDGATPFRGQGIGVPRLADVMRRHADARLIVEMKGGSAELARAVAAEIRKADAVERTCVGSFYRSSVDTMRAEFPEIYTSASQPEAQWTVYRSWLRWPFRSTRPYIAFQLPEFAGRMRVISRGFLRHVHRDGHAVQVWVVNDAPDIRRLLDWGVDGIISDRPDIAIATRDAWIASKP